MKNLSYPNTPAGRIEDYAPRRLQEDLKYEKLRVMQKAKVDVDDVLGMWVYQSMTYAVVPEKGESDSVFADKIAWSFWIFFL